MDYSFSPLKCNSWNCGIVWFAGTSFFMLTKITWFYFFVLPKIPPLPTLKMNHKCSNANTNSPVYCIWWMMHFETNLSFHVWFSSSCSRPGCTDRCSASWRSSHRLQIWPWWHHSPLRAAPQCPGTACGLGNGELRADGHRTPWVGRDHHSPAPVPAQQDHPQESPRGELPGCDHCDHFPGVPVPVPKHPLGEKPFPNIWPKLLLTNLLPFSWGWHVMTQGHWVKPPLTTVLAQGFQDPLGLTQAVLHLGTASSFGPLNSRKTFWCWSTSREGERSKASGWRVSHMRNT